MGPRKTKYHEMIAEASRRLVGDPSNKVLTKEQSEKIEQIRLALNKANNRNEFQAILDEIIPE